MDEPRTRHKNLLDAQNSLLVVIDVQERFRPHIDQYEELVANICTLVRAAETLLLPVVVTEQYTKGLGPTVGEIKNLETPGRPWRYFEKKLLFCRLGRRLHRPPDRALAAPDSGLRYRGPCLCQPDGS
jgi:nicotinamidase-related amidase